MTRKLISVACLLALAAPLAALAFPLASSGALSCCGATLCTIHRHAQPGPAKADCHAKFGANDCAMEACQKPERPAIGVTASLPPTEFAASPEAPRAFAPNDLTLFFPAPASDRDSPPPRTLLA